MGALHAIARNNIIFEDRISICIVKIQESWRCNAVVAIVGVVTAKDSQQI